MRVLITGASGFIGRALQARFVRQGFDVVAFGRAEQAAGLTLEAALDGCHAVFNLAGEPVGSGRWTTEKKAAILSSRVDRTRVLVRAILAQEKKPRCVISASAVGFYGDRGDTPVDETSPVGKGFLAEVVEAWERETLHPSLEAAGIRTAAARIGVVLGRDGGALQSMLPLFRAGLGGPIGSGRQWMSWIHLEDVVEALVHAFDNKELAGPFNVVSPNPVTMSEFAKTLGRVLERPAILPAPGVAVRLALGEMAAIVLEGQLVSPEKLLDNDFTFRFPELETALRDILREIEPTPVRSPSQFPTRAFS